LKPGRDLAGIFLPGVRVSLRGEPGQPGTLLVEPGAE
jgi:hypothetical protein